MRPEALRRCLPKWLAQWATEFSMAEEATGVDALLLAAVCGRESGGGRWLTPEGPGGVGDSGNGLGLMQIDKRYHWEFSQRMRGSKPAWQDAYSNILYGAELLSQNLRAFKGDEAGAIAAYNASALRVRRVLGSLPKDATLEARIAAVDALTTHGDYVEDVLHRRRTYAALAKQQEAA